MSWYVHSRFRHRIIVMHHIQRCYRYLVEPRRGSRIILGAVSCNLLLSYTAYKVITAI